MKNYRGSLLLAAISTALGLGSCQKEGMKNTMAGSVMAKPDLTVMPIPALFWWATLNGPPYRDTVYGDAPSEVSGGLGFSITGTGFIVGANPTLYRDYYFDPQEVWAYDTAAKSWIRKVDFPDITPTGGVSFVIGDNAYVVAAGATWQYNKPADRWTRKATTPFAAREWGVGMALNGKGYVGLGDHNGTLLSDWWQYDPTADLWTLKRKFPGTARTGAVGFALYDLGYVTAGYHALNNFPLTTYRYDPVVDTWTAVASFTGAGREFAVASSATVNGAQVGLVAGGESTTGSTLADVYEYDPNKNNWFKMQTGGAGHEFAAGFVVGRAFFDCNLNCSVLCWTK